MQRQTGPYAQDSPEMMIHHGQDSRGNGRERGFEGGREFLVIPGGSCSSSGINGASGGASTVCCLPLLVAAFH